jgi:hypothetical protein
MSKPELLEALRSQFLVAVAVQRYRLALEVYKRITDRETLAPDDRVQITADKLQALIASDEPLVVAAKVEHGEAAYWPVRRTLTVMNLNGQLDSIDLACKTHRGTIGFQPGTEWTIPAKWGDCDLTFHGQEGTSFAVVEYNGPTPIPPAAAADSAKPPAAQSSTQPQ